MLKPSEVAPLNAFVLAEVVDEVGLPAGVFNLVSGVGPVVGEAIAAHPDVDMVSFTGSTRAGKRVGELCGARIAKVALELGGKSANVILPDADFAKAVADGVGKAFFNSGQTCSALTRMLVPRVTAWPRSRRSRPRTAETHDARRSLRRDVPARPAGLPDPVGPGAGLHPEGYRRGRHAGRPAASANRRAWRPGSSSSRPSSPNVGRDMTIAQEEIFGPVLSILPYDTEDGGHRDRQRLRSTAWPAACGPATQEKAEAVARQIRTGQVEINGGAFNPNAPFGGYKQSGIGREYGKYGLEEFLLVKSMQL